MSAAGGSILLYDGTCGFCARTVQFVLRHEGTRHSLRFARLEGPTGRQLLGAQMKLARVDSVVWYEPGHGSRPARTLSRSAATIAVLHYLGGAWAVLGRLIEMFPGRARDAGYDFVARHRHRIAGRGVCVIPRPEQRSRFLDPS